MPDYRKMHFTLFNCLTDALQELEKQDYNCVRAILQEAQLKTEDLYISEETERE